MAAVGGLFLWFRENNRTTYYIFHRSKNITNLQYLWYCNTRSLYAPFFSNAEKKAPQRKERLRGGPTGTPPRGKVSPWHPLLQQGGLVLRRLCLQYYCSTACTCDLTVAAPIGAFNVHGYFAYPCGHSKCPREKGPGGRRKFCSCYILSDLM